MGVTCVSLGSQDVDHVITHWVPWFSVNSLDSDFVFDSHGTPGELINIIR